LMVGAQVQVMKGCSTAQLSDDLKAMVQEGAITLKQARGMGEQARGGARGDGGFGGASKPMLCTPFDLHAADSLQPTGPGLTQLPSSLAQLSLKTLASDIVERLAYWRREWVDVLLCDICLEAVPRKYCDKPSPDGCGHTADICANCMRAYTIEALKNAGVTEHGIRCPFVSKTAKSCSASISSASIKASLNKNDLDKYDRYKRDAIISADPSRRWCPHEPCDAVLTVTVSTICPKCKKEICAKCNGKAHTGKSCEEAADQGLGKYSQKCPSCGRNVQKIEGCNDMTCKCRNHFCYKCGLSRDSHGSSYPCR